MSRLIHPVTFQPTPPREHWTTNQKTAALQRPLGTRRGRQDKIIPPGSERHEWSCGAGTLSSVSHDL